MRPMIAAALLLLTAPAAGQEVSGPARAADGDSLDLSGIAVRLYGVDAPELEVIRADLAQAFSGLLTPQDQAAWRPHITVQNKVEPAVAKATLAELQRDFSPHPLAIAGLASWWYRGGPWQPLSRHMFA